MLRDIQHWVKFFPHYTEETYYNKSICPPSFCRWKEFAAIKKKTTYTSMINDKKLFFPLFTPRNICGGYLLESPRRGYSNKYPQHMFLGVLNTVFFNISNYLPHLELRNRSIQTVVITNFVFISHVGIKSFDCIRWSNMLHFVCFPVHSNRKAFTPQGARKKIPIEKGCKTFWRSKLGYTR